MIDFKTIKLLKESTGAGLADCKIALEHSNNDIEKAIEYLKEKNILKSAKYSIRETEEGGIAIFENKDKLIMIKICCQTDFTAKSEAMKKIYQELHKYIFDANDLNSLDPEAINFIKNTSASTQENIFIKDFYVFNKTPNSHVYYYLHNIYFPGFARLGSVVVLDKEDSDIAKELNLHIASTKPQYLYENEVPSDVLAKMKLDNEKAAEGNEKKLMGLMKKSLDDLVLMNQTFVFDNIKISKLIKDAKINSFVFLNV